MATAEGITAGQLKFSPQSALYLVEELRKQLATVEVMAYAAGAYEESRSEPDINTELLFEAIASKAADSFSYLQLKGMLEALIPSAEVAA